MTDTDTTRLRDLLTAAADAQREAETEIRRLRSAGLSWARIGGAAGITRQSAWERWRYLDTPTTSNEEIR